MKKIYQFAMLLVILTITLVSCTPDSDTPTIQGQKQGPDTYGFGYCSNDIPQSIGIADGTVNLLAAAVLMNASDMLQYGDSIVGIRCGITGSGTDFTVYITDNLEAENEDCLFVKEIGNVDGKSWVFVELDKPISIEDAGDLFFAYSINTSEYTLGYEPGSATTRDWIYAGGWQYLSDVGMNGSFNIQAVVKGGDYTGMTQNYVANTYLDVKSMVVDGESQKMKLLVTNLGVKYANNVSVSYTYGNKSGQFQDNSIGLMFGQTATLELPEVITEGTGNLVVSVSTSTQGQSSPHVVESSQISVPSGTYDRSVLIEQFTGQACVNCPAGSTAISNAINALTAEEQSRIVWIAHHAGYYSDAFTISEDTETANFFGVVGAPTAMINRSTVSSDLGLTFVASLIQSSHLSSILPVNTYATVEIDHTYNEATRELSITVSGAAPFDSPKLTVLLTQSGVQAAQTGADGLYTHNHAPRAYLTPTFGTSINYSNGSYSNTFTYTIPSTIGSIACVPEDMEIVAFLANHDNNDNSNCSVINAAKAGVTATAVNYETPSKAKGAKGVLTSVPVK